MIKIAPSILSANFSELGSDIRSAKNADYIHFDVMDGIFVPNISFGLPVLQSVRKITDIPLDVHLMIDRPVRFVKRFADDGADIVSFHIEADTAEGIREAIRILKAEGKKCGLALKPATPTSAFEEYLPELDMVVVMTVEPGFGGQSFMADQMEKIRTIRGMITAGGYDCEISVDGGVDETTAPVCIAAGANVLVAGSSIFREENRAEIIEKLRG